MRKRKRDYIFSSFHCQLVSGITIYHIETAGDIFGATTGAQMPIEGGNARVI